MREALQKHQQLSKDNSSWPSLQFPQSNYTNCTNVIDLHDTAAVSRSGQSNTSFKIESLIGGDAVACQEVKGQDLRSSDEVSKALSVDRQSEVFRNLNTHYNKSSAFEVSQFLHLFLFDSPVQILTYENEKSRAGHYLTRDDSTVPKFFCQNRGGVLILVMG